MEDVKITERQTILGGVLDEHDVNCVRYAIETFISESDDDVDPGLLDSLRKANSFLQDVVIKSKTVGR